MKKNLKRLLALTLALLMIVGNAPTVLAEGNADPDAVILDNSDLIDSADAGADTADDAVLSDADEAFSEESDGEEVQSAAEPDSLSDQGLIDDDAFAALDDLDAETAENEEVPIASVNGVEYTSLVDAFKAVAGSTATISLINDVDSDWEYDGDDSWLIRDDAHIVVIDDLSSNITLNLNGHKIRDNTGLFRINAGTLNVVDSVGQLPNW